MRFILPKNKLYVHVSYIVIFTFAILQGCQIYKMSIRQGNELEQEKLDQLKPRLTKKQVEAIIGTSTLEPSSINRLDYYFSLNPKQNGITKQQHLTLFFDNNGELNHYTGNIQLKNLPTTISNKQLSDKN